MFSSKLCYVSVLVLYHLLVHNISILFGTEINSFTFQRLFKQEIRQSWAW